MPWPSLPQRLLVFPALVLFGGGVSAGWMLARARQAGGSGRRSGTPVVAEPTRAEPAGPTRQAKRLSSIAHPQNTAPAPAQRLSPRKIAERALASTVFLRGGHVYGAGVLLDRKGHVLTCDHVIDGLKRIRAWFHGESKPIPVKVVARDHHVDLAVLKLARLPARAPLALGTVTDVAMGDEVFAMGAPMKMTFSLSHGIVSYVGRTFDGTVYVQTDLPASGGSSGGPVLNARGQLVGVSSFILRGGQGLTFFVPIDYAFERFGTQLGVNHDEKHFDDWVRSGKADRVRHTG